MSEQITLFDLFEITSGIEDEVPVSTGVMTLAEVTDKNEANTLKTVYFGDAIYDIKASGGCAVVIITIPANYKKYYKDGLALAQDYLDHINDQDRDNQFLTLGITPLRLQTGLIILFKQLVYTIGREISDDKAELILAFDNTVTEVMAPEEYNLAHIKQQIQTEHMREVEDLENEYADLQEANSKLDEEIFIDGNPILSMQDPFSDEQTEHHAEMDEDDWDYDESDEMEKGESEFDDEKNDEQY